MVASLSPPPPVIVVSLRIEMALDRLADDSELRARLGDDAKVTAVRQDFDWIRTEFFDAYDVARERAIADGVTAI